MANEDGFDSTVGAFYLAAMGSKGRQDLGGAIDRIQKGRELSVRIRRGEVKIQDLWHGQWGEKIHPGDTFAFPDDSKSFVEFFDSLVALDLEGDAIAELLIHGMGKTASFTKKALETRGYEVEMVLLAPGDYPMLDVRRFPREIGDSWPDNHWMLVMEECNAVNNRPASSGRSTLASDTDRSAGFASRSGKK